eukprot:COSAG01_NODE_6433_length_3669_cov_61.729412_3_plen_138_part_00
MDGSSTDEVPETEDEDTFDVFADYDVAHEGLPDANNEEEEAQEGPAHAPNNAPTFDVGADALFDDESGDSYDEEEDEDEEEEDEDEESCTFGIIFLTACSHKLTWNNYAGCISGRPLKHALKPDMRAKIDWRTEIEG